MTLNCVYTSRQESSCSTHKAQEAQTVTTSKTGASAGYYFALLSPIEGASCIYDEYIKKPSLADYRKKYPLFVFDHQIHQTLAKDVIGVSFDAQ